MIADTRHGLGFVWGNDMELVFSRDPSLYAFRINEKLI